MASALSEETLSASRRLLRGRGIILGTIWITLPVYLLIGLGFLSVRTGYIGAGSVPGLSRFTLRVCLPPLIFAAVALPGAERPLEAGVGLAYLAGSLAAFAAGGVALRALLGVPAARAWILSLGCGVSNSGFMGFPIAALLVGPDLAARFFAIAVIVENVVMLPLGLVAADLCRSRGEGLQRLVRTAIGLAARNPLLVSVLVGLAVRLGGVPVPGPAAEAIGMLADVAPAVALFVVGATLARYPVDRSDASLSATILVAKLLVHPALVLAAVTLTPGGMPDLGRIAVLFAAMPMISIFPILGEPFGIDRLCATALVAAVTVSFATIALWAGLLGI